MLVICDYLSGDLQRINGSPEDDFGMSEELLTQTKYSYTICVNDKPIACMGIIPLWDGVAQGWVKVDANADRHAIMLVRSAKKLIQFIMEDANLVRMHTPIRAESKKIIKWVEMIGFKFESKMEKAGQGGKDMLMYKVLR